MIFLIDANNLVRLEDSIDSRHREAMSAVERLKDFGHESHIVPQVLYEFWVVATRPVENNGLGLDSIKAEDAIHQWMTFFRWLCPINGSDPLLAVPWFVFIDEIEGSDPFIGQSFFRLRLDERGIFRNWTKLVAVNQVRGKVAHDSRLVAAMERHGIANLLTFNPSDFGRFTSFNVRTPADLIAGKLTI